jgi:hypothetical protein
MPPSPAVATPDTATPVPDGPPRGGWCALNLTCDADIALASTAQIVVPVSDAIGVVGAERTLTLISGPSTASDIELERTERAIPRTRPRPPIPPDHFGHKCCSSANTPVSPPRRITSPKPY